MEDYRFEEEMAAHSSSRRRRRKKKKKHTAVKAILIILAILLTLGIAAAIALKVYTSQIDEKMNEGSEALDGVLSEANDDEPFYVLVVGSDAWEGYANNAHNSGSGLSDALMLVRVDPKDTPTITMVSVPRDTPYEIDGQTVKLNEAFKAGGPQGAIEAVSKLTGVEISHYAQVGFEDLEAIVDDLGGITVDVPYTIDYDVYTHDQPTVHIEAGEQFLSGKEVVALTRMRTAYHPSGLPTDAVRQANVRAIFVALLKEVMRGTPAEIPGHIQQLASMVHTDITSSELVGWGTAFANADSINVYMTSGPVEGGLDKDTGLWLTKEAPEKWAALMEAVDKGEDPSTVEGINMTSKDGKVSINDSEQIDMGTSNAKE